MLIFQYKGKTYKLTTSQYATAFDIRMSLGTMTLGDAFAECINDKD